MSNLYSFKSPYVHSNLSRLNKNLSGSGLDNRSEEGQQRLSQQIQELMQVRDFLKAEADAFLGGMSYQNFFSELDSNSSKMAQIGIEILNRQHTIDILSGKLQGYSQSDLTTAFPQLEPVFNKTAQEEITYSLPQATEIVVEQLMSKMPKRGAGAAQAQMAVLADFFGTKKTEIEKDLAINVRGILKSKDGKIKNVVKQAIRNKTKTMGNERATFIAYFRKEFLTLAKQKLNFVTQSEIEDYLKDVESRVYALDNSVFTGEQSSTTGKLGEDFFKAVTMGGNALALQIDLTGMMSEQDMQARSDIRAILTSILTTHHSASKESQTDMLITSNKTGKTVRVQSKNLQAAYHSLVSVRPFPGFAQIQGATKYLTLIEHLQDSQTIHLNETELGELSYLLANELWFRTHQSMDIGRARGVSSSGSTMGNVVTMVNQLLSKEITNFMGINIEEVIHPQAASSANAFYLIANRVLLPSYLIIEDLIQELQQMQGEFSRLSVSIELTGSYGSADEFYKAKLNAVGSFDSAGDYTDSALVQVGQLKGAEIISNLGIRKIGLKFNMQKLMNSSYVAF